MVCALPITNSGDGSVATPEMGEFKMTTWIDGIVKAIRAVKANEESLKLQNNFSRSPSIPGHTPLAGQFLTIQRTKARKGREPSFIPNPARLRHNLGNVGRGWCRCYAPYRQENQLFARGKLNRGR